MAPVAEQEAQHGDTLAGRAKAAARELGGEVAGGAGAGGHAGRVAGAAIVAAFARLRRLRLAAPGPRV